jgi:hypothetical protein
MPFYRIAPKNFLTEVWEIPQHPKKQKRQPISQRLFLSHLHYGLVAVAAVVAIAANPIDTIACGVCNTTAVNVSFADNSFGAVNV